MAKTWRMVGRGEKIKILFYTANASYKKEKKRKKKLTLISTALK